MKKQLSRREFLKGSLAGAATLAATGILGSTSVLASDEEAIYIPGTYTATSAGHSGDITVTMTFDKTSIVDVILDVSNETTDIGQKAGDELREQILASQGAQIDGVSGASITSKGVRNAVTMCIQKAKGEDPVGIIDAGTATTELTADWLGEAPVITDSDCVEIIDTEVLVVGAGCAGLPAALTAAEEGAKVLLIEKLESGASIRSSAIAAIGTKMQKEHGVEISKTEIINDYAHYALNHNDMELLKLWADNSGEAIDWFFGFVDGMGTVDTALEYTMPEHETYYKMWPVGHGTKVKGIENVMEAALMAEPVVGDAMCKALAEHDGCEFRNFTAMQCVIMEDGRAVGVYAKNADGEYIRINASKGVVLATGGYANNEVMYKALQPENYNGLVGSMCMPGATGDGIKAALWSGANFDKYHDTMIFDRGALKPDAEGDPFGPGMNYYHMGSQPFLKVDKDGKRICNESSPYDFIVHAAYNRKGHHWYQIFDANWKADCERFHTIGCSTVCQWEGGNHHCAGIDAEEMDINRFVEAGVVVKADTLEELADKLMIDKDTFLATVDRYNELYDKQEDDDYGKEAFRLSELRTAPFFGVKLGGYMLCTLDGVQINTNTQVLGKDGNPIPGLFAVGNDSGRYYASTYPNFAPGANAGRCVTFGRICGKYLAAL